jgi:hypothetical protein
MTNDTYKIIPANSPDRTLENWFTHHPPANEGVAQVYQEVRNGGREFAELIVDECPLSYERDEALKKIREAVMWANAAVACNAPL